MRVNSKVFDETQDMFTELHVKGCPTQLQTIADRLLNMVADVGYSVGEYHTMTELDKILTVDYWNKYDNLALITDFKEWYIKHATEPDTITRVRRLLIEKNYLIVPENIRENAQQASDKYRNSIRR